MMCLGVEWQTLMKHLEHGLRSQERVFELCGVPQTRGERVPQAICLCFCHGRRQAGVGAAADGAAAGGP